MVRGLVLDRRVGSAYVKLVRSIPLPLLIATVRVKGFVFGWLGRSAALKGSCPARGSYA
jgi:hypothetical protein